MKPLLPSGAARPASAADLPQLAAWLGRPLALPTAPGEHLLVLDAPAPGGEPRPAATLRLVPGIGLALPRLWYRLGTTVHAAKELGLFHRQRTLMLGHDLTGASELADIACDTALLNSEAQAQALAALVQAALACLQAERALHGEQLIVELPGLRDASGASPFWQGLGRHFYGGDPVAARQAHGAAWRTHVAGLMPRHLLYASFLPPAAQAAIGQTGEGAQPLQQALQAAGLRDMSYVNLEDGGPVVGARIDDLCAGQ
jgi:arginine N-succinyltransferase